ncbi:MAG: hypothetical protein Q8O25_00525 [Sulfurisoma sp.]|nr:hypothetical protein [Sulfurisoma sp.]
MSDSNDYRYILTEAIEGLIESASAIKSDSQYDAGRKMAYFEILQAVESLAEEVGLEKSEIGLGAFNHGALVGLKKAA